MIHALLVLAAILFVIWLLFHAVAAIVHVLWILIVAAVVVWVVRMLLQGNRRA